MTPVPYSRIMSSSYERLHTNFNQYNPSTRLRHTVAILSGLVGILGYAVVVWMFARFTNKTQYSFLDNYQYINARSIINSSVSHSHNPAIFSSLFSDSYVYGIAVLAYSIQNVNVSANIPLILPYIPSQISPSSLCIAQTLGWKPHPVSLITPPHNGAGVSGRFTSLYTKLRVWELGEQLGHNIALFLDADTLVLRPFPELFHFNWEFGAGQDILIDTSKPGFPPDFNTGVFVFRPSKATFIDMQEKWPSARYPAGAADQAFLNLYFGGKGVRLPYAYNGNMVIKERSRALWDELMESDMRVLHYTLVKPFWDDSMLEHGKGKLMTPEEVRNYTEEVAAKRMGGRYADEVGIWREVFEKMMKEYGKDIEACYVPENRG